MTFGLGTNREGQEENGLDNLIAALLPYQGKQVNFAIHISEKVAASGKKFPSAFVMITEMIPKDAQVGQMAFVPKTTSRAAAVKATTEKLNKQFGG